MISFLEKSINELESSEPFHSTEFESSLIATCYKLRDKKLQSYSTEDLRVMIGQNIGLTWLIPLALDKLQVDILAEGDFYEGDLLVSVLKTSPSYWRNHSLELATFTTLLEKSLTSLATSDAPKAVLENVYQSLPKLRAISFV
ncbi:contact-dependent growth inhibition system immunity protein [Siphonobacter sp. SORGH_AS_1065]|uniref:contact-dependent growth inhibition system immunity protein n=1 Tax=Siphonobacter sp. SORGH_AS_1065 TaxID=3041795 RepID=UPI00278814C6|nr:contact-dependent growth inhibition system immunity protein [Siphonobacter sp. SORGH_AS_1065]MDQ1087527.1 hypothetical protein [Siphonobacter sp. SORGH_AS_1065]